ncbi:hypothetical protein DFH06DRAFT_1114725 [Mycena polygramma]|nr:hypothetical protein DFH06DRAFT_1114725 [Mycena polygramma]
MSTPQATNDNPTTQVTNKNPILVWALSLNREYRPEEYDACYKVVKDCVPHVKIAYDPRNAETFRQIMTQLLPLLMMCHRRVLRAEWHDHVTPNGKHWIETLQDMPPEKVLCSMIGYHLTYDTSLCGMAMTQGTQRKVINIGLGIKRLAIEPRGVSVATYVESMAHKLTPAEKQLVAPGLGDEVVLRRLCTLLALKAAYLHAIGQPKGFDWTRLDFDIPRKTARGDGHPLQGWEFRIFHSSLGVARKDKLVEEDYKCVCAFFRGGQETSFIWHEDLASWVQFINIDQMVKVVPKLSQ